MLEELISRMRDAIAALFARLGNRLAVLLGPAPLGRHTAAHLAAVRLAPRDPVQASPWTAPWTGPTKEEAQAVLLAREESERTVQLRADTAFAPPVRRRLYIAPHGIPLDRPVAVRTARPGTGWGWLR